MTHFPGGTKILFYHNRNFVILFQSFKTLGKVFFFKEILKNVSQKRSKFLFRKSTIQQSTEIPEAQIKNKRSCLFSLSPVSDCSVGSHSLYCEGIRLITETRSSKSCTHKTVLLHHMRWRICFIMETEKTPTQNCSNTC